MDGQERGTLVLLDQIAHRPEPNLPGAAVGQIN